MVLLTFGSGWKMKTMMVENREAASAETVWQAGATSPGDKLNTGQTCVFECVKAPDLKRWRYHFTPKSVESFAHHGVNDGHLQVGRIWGVPWLSSFCLSVFFYNKHVYLLKKIIIKKT